MKKHISRLKEALRGMPDQTRIRTLVEICAEELTPYELWQVIDEVIRYYANGPRYAEGPNQEIRLWWSMQSVFSPLFFSLSASTITEDFERKYSSVTNSTGKQLISSEENRNALSTYFLNQWRVEVESELDSYPKEDRFLWKVFFDSLEGLNEALRLEVRELSEISNNRGKASDTNNARTGEYKTHEGGYGQIIISPKGLEILEFVIPRLGSKKIDIHVVYRELEYQGELKKGTPHRDFVEYLAFHWGNIIEDINPEFKIPTYETLKNRSKLAVERVKGLIEKAPHSPSP
ncbi:hypothetical protein HZ996_03180 [Cryomorphaceae bacterium]|nr:hypothetical protein HZ996_03180 [Cryomorphaceae bacterium]